MWGVVDVLDDGGAGVVAAALDAEDVVSPLLHPGQMTLG